MKKLIYTLLLLSLSTLLMGQSFTQPVIGKYYWNKNVFLSSCNRDGSTHHIDSNKLQIITNGKQLFYVIDTTMVTKQIYAVVRILNYSEAKQTSQFYDYNFIGSPAQYANYIREYPNATSYGVYQRYFRVKATDLVQVAVPYTFIGGALAGGVINFPFKLRLQKDANDFSSAFNLGGAFGYTFPHYSFRNFTYSALFAAALSNVTLDASNVSRNTELLNSANNFSALTFAIGGLVQYDRFQAGIFLGIDRIGKLNHQTFNWAYQNKPWISIGFGYAIFSVEKEAATTSLQQP